MTFNNLKDASDNKAFEFFVLTGKVAAYCMPFYYTAKKKLWRMHAVSLTYSCLHNDEYAQNVTPDTVSDHAVPTARHAKV